MSRGSPALTSASPPLCLCCASLRVQDIALAQRMDEYAAQLGNKGG